MITKDQARVAVQIAYVPTHAEGNIDHPDVEFGFISGVPEIGDVAYCRFWSTTHEGLRTLANSELVCLNDLVLCVSRSEEEVEAAIQTILKAAYNWW